MQFAHIQHDGKRWKHYYADSELDATRTSITLDELTTIRWAFCFKSNPFFAVEQNEHRVHDYPSFHRDYTCTSHILHRVLRWRFPTRDQNTIQVEHFPYLVISRTSDWGWKMTNAAVMFTSMDVDDNEFAILQEHLRAHIEIAFRQRAAQEPDDNLHEEID